MLTRLVFTFVLLGAALYAQSITIPPDLIAKRVPLVADTETVIERVGPTGTMRQTFTGRLLRSADGRHRQDTPISSVITDASGLITLINHAVKEYMVMPRPAPPAAAGSAQTAQPQVYVQSRKVLGTRTVEGLQVEGEELVVATHDSSAARPPVVMTMEVWRNSAVGVPVLISRTDVTGSVKQRLHNIALKEPDSKAFSVPEGYRHKQQVPNTPVGQARP